MVRPLGAWRPASTLTISGQGVQVDARPTFLLGVSLFDALGPVAPRDSDLEALHTWGVNLVRVWAHWHEPIYQSDGALTPQGQSRLEQLVRRLDARNMVLELVLLRPGQLPGQPYRVFDGEPSRLHAVEAITTALRAHRNILFDLYNEHDHPDGPISHRAARALRDRVKAIDPQRLVTISSTEGHLIGPDGKMDNAQRRNLAEEVGTGAGAVNVDLLAPHFPRTDDWSAATAMRVGTLRAALAALGRPVPIYLNEERRSEPSKPLPADAYARAVTQARMAGAAGWVFHTDAGYSLDKRSFVDALGTQERAALPRLKGE